MYLRTKFCKTPTLYLSFNVTLSLNTDVVRVRRSIPEVDAVNPDYMNGEVPSGQEEHADPQQSISQLPLVDHVDTLFSSGKDDKIAQMSQDTQEHEGSHDSLARQEKSAVEGLTSDEQADCYKQQNIDTPGVEESIMKRQNSRGMSIVDMSQRLQPSFSRNQATRDRSWRRNNRIKEKEEITSLYSEPQKVVRIKSAKHGFRSKVDEAAKDTPKRVYKPTGILPQFPVYDEDIDFQPDPLQGILEDKYWQDQEDQEGVIRKYMDLAINNMMPPNSEIDKRDAERTNYQAKSITSNLAFRGESNERERGCPCKEVVACGECSKGKSNKKSNFTEAEDEVPFGRNLLSLDNGKREDVEDNNDVSSFKNIAFLNQYDSDKKTHIYKKSIPNYSSNLLGRKLLSFTDVDSDYDEDGEENYEDEVSESSYRRLRSYDGNQNHKRTKVFGRKLLSFTEVDSDLDEDGEENYEDEISESSYRRLRFDDADQNHKGSKVFNVYSTYDDNVNNIQRLKPYYEYVDSEPVIEHQENKDTEDAQVLDEFTNNKKAEDTALIYNPAVHNLPNKPAQFYTPNKWANRLQKFLQPKEKGPHTRTKGVNMTEEFAIVQSETLRNASLVQATYKPINKTTPQPLNTTINITTTINLESTNPPKGRRSYSEPFLFDLHRISNLAETSDDAVARNNLKVINMTTSSSQPSNSSEVPFGNNTLVSNSTNNVTVSQWNITSVSSVATTKATVTPTVKKKAKFDEEETIDAEVANDIVETVIAESQRSSVLGNSLGLCRRNDSLNVRYGRVIPETEKVLRTVTECLMKRLKNHLAKQSCIILDSELLEFLQWIVLKGESSKDYVQRSSGKFHIPKPAAPAVNLTTCGPVVMASESTSCDPALEAPPPPDQIVSNFNNSMPT
ncbi:hypothetical protein J6590_033635 [Homalodisca vitripennis]|nr:hypothetical protein J6590_033635 [Homalodisca vitripennis]